MIPHHHHHHKHAPRDLANRVPLSFPPITDQLIDASAAGKPIIPVGTTSVRTLESLFWWGVRLLDNKHGGTKMQSVADMTLGQWEPYQRGVTRRDRPFPTAAAALVRGSDLCI